MKTIIYIITLFLLPALLFGQENLVIKGQVTDAETLKPLMDCHVFVSNQPYGTITDEMGNFEIEIPKRYMTQCLIISHMGYEKEITIIHEIGNRALEIVLEYKVIELSELVITPDQYWITYNEIFDPYVREVSEPSPVKIHDDIIEAISIDKMNLIKTMY